MAKYLLDAAVDLYLLVMDWIVEKTSGFGVLKMLGKKLGQIEEVLNLP